MQEKQIGKTARPKKSKKILLALVTIVVVIIVILLVFFVILGDDSEKIYGTWKIDNVQSDVFGNFSADIENTTITFSKDHTYIIQNDENTGDGEWELKNNKIYFTTDDQETIDKFNINLVNPFGWDYTFSNGNKNLKLSFTVVFSISFEMSKI